MAANPVSFEEAVALLKAGEICAFPTETVYGLGADATNSGAVLKIYETKKRPRFNPLIAHCADFGMARSIAVFSPLAEKVAALWPGALTLVLPLRPEAGISDLVTAGLGTIGVRVPDLSLARDLIAAVSKPLAAPSANPSGRLSPTTAAMVRAAFHDCVPVLDGGACEKGVESTILAVDGNKIVQLRAGALPRSVVEAATGMPVEVAGEGAEVLAPGMLKSHYAPRAHLRLNAESVEPGEAYLGFGRHEGPSGALNLSPAGDLDEAARNLFAMLALLDEKGATGIAVAPVPDEGLGEAINDRLQRAAAPRDGN
ncbi:MAG: threonylcarbamoyl-AMP synthase [Hyphomicrobiaceae bacterium]|nr:threonylcarbamoyl-AMP synthase [Hyphomicrobiaceae bacterium]